MDPSYERPLTGADVIARARTAGIGPETMQVITATIPPDAEFPDPAVLARAIAPARLGMTPGRWNHVFGPLFGEFE
jgi:hypothetical protein